MSISVVAANPARGPYVPPLYDPAAECMKIMEAFVILKIMANAAPEHMGPTKVLVEAFEEPLHELYKHLSGIDVQQTQ